MKKILAIYGASGLGKEVLELASIINKDIPNEMIAIGNPARLMAKNEARRVFGG